jgi:hypothetical protein
MRRILEWVVKKAFPWVGTLITALPYHRRVSLFLDKLLVLSEQTDDYANP